MAGCSIKFLTFFLLCFSLGYSVIAVFLCTQVWRVKCKEHHNFGACVVNIMDRILTMKVNDLTNASKLSTHLEQCHQRKAAFCGPER